MRSVVNIHQAKTHLSRLVDQAMEGQEIIIAKSGKPLVRLLPVAQDRPPRQPGSMKGRLHVPPDFDAPLPDEILAQFEGDA